MAENTAQQQPTGIARKITAKTVTGMSADDIAKAGRKEKTILYHIIGSAGDSKTIETSYGPSTALLGQFEAINAETGESFYSGVAYLPPHITNMIGAQMKKSDSPTQFALSVGVQPSDSRFGYEYFAETYIDPKADEQLSSMRKLLPPPRKSLPKPKA